jgi:ABC-2 type transport system permease protein
VTSARLARQPVGGTTRSLRGPRGARWAIAWHVFNESLRGAVIWGVVFGIWVISTIRTFESGYPTLAQRRQLTQSLASFAMMLGIPHNAQTVAGFTAWRILLAAATIGAIWGLVTSTSLLRGEEVAGRWEILLAGPTTARRATLQALIGLNGAFAVMYVACALLTLAAGRAPRAHFAPAGSLLFAFGLVAGAAMFLAVGALTSQLSATRAQAATIAGMVLGGAYVVRMIADSRTSLGWVRWLSPLGWVEELRPFESAQPIALIPIVAFSLIASLLAVWLAGRRDLGASVVPEGASSSDSGWWLRGPTTLGLGLTRSGALAWLGSTAGFGAIYGTLTRAATTLLSGSPTITAALGRLGVRQATNGYLGIVFFIADLLIAVIAATQIAGIRDEEASGRLENLLVRPIGRAHWLVSRLAISTSLVLLVGIDAGFFAWLGAESQHVHESLPTLVEAGLNAAIPGVFVLGAGALVFGLRPRFAVTASYAIVAWSFLVDLLGSFLKGSDWLRDSSLFTHIALMPAAKADWGTAAIIALLGLSGAVLGILAFQRRDLAYE